MSLFILGVVVLLLWLFAVLVLMWLVSSGNKDQGLLEDALTSDHMCLRNSILNLIQLVPVPEDIVEQIDAILCACIQEVETNT